MAAELLTFLPLSTYWSYYYTPPRKTAIGSHLSYAAQQVPSYVYRRYRMEEDDQAVKKKNRLDTVDEFDDLVRILVQPVASRDIQECLLYQFFPFCTHRSA